MKTRNELKHVALNMMLKRAKKQLRQRTCKPIAKHASQMMAKKVPA